MTAFAEYLAAIRKKLALGDATEHTHRAALEHLLEAVGKGITATNEPKRIACGAPDFNITRNKVPIGHVETKDIGVSHTQERGRSADTSLCRGITWHCPGSFPEGIQRSPQRPKRDIRASQGSRAFCMWLAGGGIKPGITVGQTDELGYNPVEDPIEVHDLHATLLYLMGIDHTKLTYRFQGRDFRLTDISGNVVKQLLA